MAFKMVGFSAFTKDTKYKESKHDTGGFVEGQLTGLGDGPTDEELKSVKEAFKNLDNKNDIVKNNIFKKYNMNISSDGTQIEVDAKTMKK